MLGKDKRTEGRAMAPKERGMPKELEELLEWARKVEMTAGEKEEQRRSFAYGNTNIENPLITRETVDRQADELKASNDDRK
jgi:hypothetical protein